ncbi:tRNA adenosine(34) deaminase TadA [bacterium]|nr:tRNA adenosine(34) deaminase TadA [bacterium]
MNLYEMWMQTALKEAAKAFESGEVPVGAVVAHEDKIIGKGYNQTESLQDPTAHAEMIAISAAANTLQSWRLENCTLIVTLEPCTMCAGAAVLSRIDTLVFGAVDPKAGACGTLWNIVQDHRLNHQIEIIPGILANESSLMLKTFFQNVRKTKRDQRVVFG